MWVMFLGSKGVALAWLLPQTRGVRRASGWFRVAKISTRDPAMPRGHANPVFAVGLEDDAVGSVRVRGGGGGVSVTRAPFTDVRRWKKLPDGGHSFRPSPGASSQVPLVQGKFVISRQEPPLFQPLRGGGQSLAISRPACPRAMSLIVYRGRLPTCPDLLQPSTPFGGCETADPTKTSG